MQINDQKILIEACKAGDTLAQMRLYNLYAKAMFNICMRMINIREEAEDILQEAFCEVFTHLHSYRVESSFGAWLKRIVINRCINALKRKKVNFELRDDIHKIEETDTNCGKQEINELEVKHIQKAMKQLPDGYRTIFSLYLLEGYDHTEIAGILSISESTSRSQYKRAKQKVKKLLMQQYNQRRKQLVI